ncbi:MAG: ATPase inhibitor subunit zeta [Rhizomicrobium sp.]
MRLFEQRERAFEAKWAHEEEMRFRLIARRDELLARWAASELDLDRDRSEAYVDRLMRIGLTGKDQGLFAAIRDDLSSAKGVTSELAILRKMDQCLKVACRELEMEPEARPKADKS